MSNLSLLTDEQARSLFRQELKEYFANHPLQIEQKKDEPEIVDLDGLLTHRPILGSKSTIYKKVNKGTIPFAKRGKKLFFNLKEIDDWIMSNKPKSLEQMEQETTDFLNRKRGAGTPLSKKQ